jgi:Tol biopolymer transport system component
MSKRTVAALVAAIAAFGLALASASLAAAATTERVDLTSSGKQSTGYEHSTAISADGRYVAFTSSAPDLVPGNSGDVFQVYVRDRKLHTTQQVSVSPTGAPGRTDSRNPVISADGRYVAFSSRAENLVPGESGIREQVYVRDLKLDKTTEVSVPSHGGTPNHQSFSPVISATGRYIAFDSQASNLVAHDRNETEDVFVRDQKLGITQLVSVSGKRHQANRPSFTGAISLNGRYVAFNSAAGNLVRHDTNKETDVFVRDRKRHKTKRVSVSSSGKQGDGESFGGAMSSDGRYVVFDSNARNLVNDDTNKKADVFVRDRKLHTTRRLSVSSRGRQGDKASFGPTISADGRYIAFASDATNLVSGDTNKDTDVFVRDRKRHATERVSVSSAGKQGNGDSDLSSISADGSWVAFVSEASNLVPGDTNGTPDVFVRGPLP